MVEVMESISYPLYDKYFTSAELQDLIAFYKSPTGRKTISVMPGLLAESIGRASAAMSPTINEIMMEAMDEGSERVKNEVSDDERVSGPSPAKQQTPNKALNRTRHKRASH